MASPGAACPNNLTTAAQALALLERAGVPCLLFGGWAEELLDLRASTRPVTWFWGDVPLVRQAPVAHPGPVVRGDRAFEVVSAANLRLYRTRHRETQPWRWRTFSGAC